MTSNLNSNNNNDDDNNIISETIKDEDLNTKFIDRLFGNEEIFNIRRRLDDRLNYAFGLDRGVDPNLKPEDYEYVDVDSTDDDSSEYYYETESDEYDSETDFSIEYDESFTRNFNSNLVIPFRLAMQSLMGRDLVDTLLLESESEVDSDGFSAWLTQTPESMYFFNVRMYLGVLKRSIRDPILKARIESFSLFLDSLREDSESEQLIRICEDFRCELVEAFGRPLPDFPAFDDVQKSRGLSKAEIKRLPRHLYRGLTQREKRLNEKPHKCCICMAELEVEEELILLEKCSHRFHSGCLEAWLRRSNQCPICRSSVLERNLI